MKKNDKGMEELLHLLKTHPELITALVFDPVSIKRLLKSKAARRLILGADVRTFLRYVSGPKHGGPVAMCRRGTRSMSPVGDLTHCPPGLGTGPLKSRGCRRSTRPITARTSLTSDA